MSSSYLKKLPMLTIKKYAEQKGLQFTPQEEFYDTLSQRLSNTFQCSNTTELITGDELTGDKIFIEYLNDDLMITETFCYDSEKNNIVDVKKILTVTGDNTYINIPYYKLPSGHYVTEDSFPLSGGIYQALPIRMIEEITVYQLVRERVTLQILIDMIIQQNKKTNAADYTGKTEVPSTIVSDSRSPEWE